MSFVQTKASTRSEKDHRYFSGKSGLIWHCSEALHEFPSPTGKASAWPESKWPTVQH